MKFRHLGGLPAAFGQTGPLAAQTEGAGVASAVVGTKR